MQQTNYCVFLLTGLLAMYPVAADDGGKLVETDDDGPHDAVKLLPPELWISVLEKLGEPTDILNSAETCYLFQDLLVDIAPASRLGEVVPLVAKYLQLKDLLVLRSVSRMVKRSTDNVLDNLELMSRYWNVGVIRARHPPPSESPMEPSFEFQQFRHLLRQPIGVRIDSLEEMQQLEDEVAVSPSSRQLVGKCLILEDSSENYFMDVDFVERSIAMIRTLSCNLQHLNVDIFPADQITLGIYATLRRILEAAPNLRTLRFQPREAEEWDEEPEDELQQYTVSNPLPTMPFLKKLILVDYHLPTRALLEISSKYGPQLVTFKKEFDITLYGHRVLEENPSLLEDSINYPALLDFSMDLTWSMREYLYTFTAPALVSYGLTLRRSDDLANAPMSPSQFLNIFRRFPFLKVFIFDFHFKEEDVDPVTEDFFSDNRNCLPSVETLRMCVEDSLLHRYPLRLFLKMFPNLKLFSVSLRFERDVFGLLPLSPDPDLRLLGANRMEESSLWDQAPSLKRVAFSASSSTGGLMIRSRHLRELGGAGTVTFRHPIGGPAPVVIVEQMREMRATLARVEARQDAIENEIAAVKAQQETTENDIAAIKARQDAMDNDIAAVKAVHDSLNRRIEALEGKRKTNSLVFRCNGSPQGDSLVIVENGELAEEEGGGSAGGSGLPVMGMEKKVEGGSAEKEASD